MPSTGSRGASSALFACVFVLLSAWAVRELRIGPVGKKAGELLEPVVNSKIIEEYGNTELRYDYTGIAGVDFILRFLVVVFLPGALGIDQGIKLQAVYFLLSFFPVVAIMSIEAGRLRNKWSLIYFTSVWAVLYQSVGGAVMIPLYHLAYLKSSSAPNYWSPPSRAVSLPYAQALLPSLVLGYLLPTILVYFPQGNVFVTQGYIAIWQIAPVIVNLLLFVLAPTYAVGQPRTNRNEENLDGDVKYLKRVYMLSFFIGAISHWAAAAICFLSSDPNLSFMHAFWPRGDLFLGQMSALTLSECVHYIFQMDCWIIFGSCLVWAYMAVLDMNRISNQSFVPPAKALAVMALNTVLFGPAATVAAVWYSRELKMAGLAKAKAL
ncbi:uncharacterized protein PV09_03195 [Verruconis gallopava]|uniref:Uncharacterized protein n=1 Tax=Verruconis gallopava TaxID=253628 RepID=A0A0D2B492_9PEZI|nr:uncharacterized protein PV09_03195 [Verruconis gallopava]KIW06014.1 hypothetical protein PV09_03195 [Verruconis gallopava]